VLIDWFTVGAQTLNFIILVWLLKRFLYKPILGAINARERRIAQELADADAKQAEARSEQEDFRRKNEELDAQRDALLKRAKEEAEVERQRLADETRRECDALRKKQAAALKTDARHLNDAIRARAQVEILAISKMVLTDLCTASLEEQTVDVFIGRLRDLELGAKNVLGEELKSGEAPALVRTAFELSMQQKQAVHKALSETFTADVAVRFETAPDLICGIELTTKGQKLAWSVADYLGSLEKGVTELVRTRADAAEKPAISPGDRPRLEPQEPVRASKS
jgi:F-type H+-transporting ATPase subunit b